MTTGGTPPRALRAECPWSHQRLLAARRGDGRTGSGRAELRRLGACALDDDALHRLDPWGALARYAGRLNRTRASRPADASRALHLVLPGRRRLRRTEPVDPGADPRAAYGDAEPAARRPGAAAGSFRAAAAACSRRRGGRRGAGCRAAWRQRFTDAVAHHLDGDLAEAVNKARPAADPASPSTWNCAGRPRRRTCHTR